MNSVRRTLAFTLLEAMIALIVLAGVASACLQLRAQSLRGRAAAAEATTREAALDDLLQQAMRGLLFGEPPERQSGEGDNAPARLVWTGELDGDAYRIVREPLLAPRPAIPIVDDGATRDDAAQDEAGVWVFRWSAAWRGRTIEEWRQP